MLLRFKLPSILRGIAWTIIITSVNGITVLPGGDPKPYSGPAGVNSSFDFYRQSAPNVFANIPADVHTLLSNHENEEYFDDGFTLLPSSNSFVRGAIQAWGEHLHLAISPDAVWLTVLAQLNVYIGAHPHEVRGLYDLASPPEPLPVDYPDWYAIMSRFFLTISARAGAADWVPGWLMPNFTTTTDDENAAALIQMSGMGRLSYRFADDKGGALLCGLPSATLLGTREDWQTLLDRLESFPAWGAEPAAYGARLRPILRRFVASWAEPDSRATKDFWNQMVTARESSHGCQGPSFNITGWITGFHFWDMEGEPYQSNITRGEGERLLSLDNVTYPSLDIRALPVGYATTPFSVNGYNDTAVYEAWALAGPVGKRVDNGAPDGYFDALNRTAGAAGGNGSYNQAHYDASQHATLTPLASWILYGPLAHNITAAANKNATVAWLPEQELADLGRAIQNGSGEKSCVLGGAMIP